MFFGRLSEEKGVHTLLKAAEIAHSYIDELVIIGRGELENLVKEKSSYGHLKGKIRLNSWLNQEELIKEITNSTMAVLPSKEESFGNSIAEAMACGIPVISTKVGSIPEIIEHNKEGILVDIDQPQQIADEIISLSKNKQRRSLLGKRGKKKIKKSFSWKNTVKRYLEIY